MIGLFHFNGLGDHVLAWPAIRAVAAAHPGQVMLLEGPGKSCVLYQDVAFADRVDVAIRRTDEPEIDVASVSARCDTLLALAAWVNPTLLDLAMKLGARRTIGFHQPYDVRVPWVPGRHMFDNYFALAQTLAPRAQLADFVAPPVYSVAATAAARALRDQLLGPARKLLFVHPETRADKMWTQAGWASTLRGFLAARPDYAAVVVTSGDHPLDLPELRGRVTTSHAHLELALALLQASDLFLGIDSVFLHAADLGALPGVGIFGPAHPPEVWGFRLSPRGAIVATDSLATLPADPVVAALLEAAR